MQIQSGSIQDVEVVPRTLGFTDPNGTFSIVSSVVFSLMMNFLCDESDDVIYEIGILQIVSESDGNFDCVNLTLTDFSSQDSTFTSTNGKPILDVQPLMTSRTGNFDSDSSSSHKSSVNAFLYENFFR